MDYMYFWKSIDNGKDWLPVSVRGAIIVHRDIKIVNGVIKNVKKHK